MVNGRSLVIVVRIRQSFNKCEIPRSYDIVRFFYIDIVNKNCNLSFFTCRLNSYTYPPKLKVVLK